MPDIVPGQGVIRGALDPREPILTKPDGTVTRFYSIKKDKATPLKSALQKTFHVDDKVVNVSANWIVAPKGKGSTDLMEVSGSPELVARIHDTIHMLEAELPQVEIEARVVEVTAEDDFQLGVVTIIDAIQGYDGAGNPVFSDKTLFRRNEARYDSTDFLNALTGNTPFQGAVFDLGAEHDDFLYNILIQTLIKEGRAELLSAPKITVLNGYTATINVGDETPIFKGRAVNRNTVLVDVSFRQTGINLSVTPYVIGRGLVQLVLTPEVSAVTGFTSAAGGSFANPIVSTRKASTCVNIRDGSSFVIGGLLTKRKIEEESKTPILGDIPLIKNLFRSKRSQTENTQIVFIITPRVIYPGSGSEKVIIPPSD